MKTKAAEKRGGKRDNAGRKKIEGRKQFTLKIPAALLAWLDARAEHLGKDRNSVCCDIFAVARATTPGRKRIRQNN